MRFVADSEDVDFMWLDVDFLSLGYESTLDRTDQPDDLVANTLFVSKIMNQCCIALMSRGGGFALGMRSTIGAGRASLV